MDFLTPQKRMSILEKAYSAFQDKISKIEDKRRGLLDQTEEKIRTRRINETRQEITQLQ